MNSARGWRQHEDSALQLRGYRIIGGESLMQTTPSRLAEMNFSGALQEAVDDLAAATLKRTPHDFV
jgi:hypothetical protein